MPLTPTTHNEARPSYYLERGWTQNEMAVNIHGDECSPHSDQAIAYCMLGSVQAAGQHLELDQETHLRQALYWVVRRTFKDQESVLDKYARITSRSQAVVNANDELINSQDEALKLMREAEAESGIWDD